MVSGKLDIEMKEEPEFSDPKEEAAYWRQVAEEYAQKLQETRDEFDEFQEGSRELESELEAQLEQAEIKMKDLLALKQRLEQENESLKEKLESTQNEAYLQITELQDENAQIRAVKEEMAKYIREVEQTNDDLERAKRATVCSLEDFEHRLNQAIEKNVLLENELDEKEELMVTVQRLKDEARDLRAEMAVQSSKPPFHSLEDKQDKPDEMETTDKVDNSTNTSLQIKDSNMDTLKTNHVNIGTSPTSNYLSNPAMTPSARISALNIVGDLLRKVGALESKLASCRNFVQDHPRHTKPNSIGNSIDSPRNKKQSNNRSGGQAGMHGLVKVVV